MSNACAYRRGDAGSRHPTLVVKTAGVSIYLALLLATAGTAHADPSDYVVALDNRGVRYPDSGSAVDTGQRVCSDLRNGEGVPRSVMRVKLSGYSQDDAWILLMAAATNLCPEAMPVVAAWQNPQPEA